MLRQPYWLSSDDVHVSSGSYPSQLDPRLSKESNSTALDHLYVRSVAGSIVPAVLSTTTVCASLASIEALRALSLTSGASSRVNECTRSVSVLLPMRTITRLLRSGSGLPSVRARHPIRHVTVGPRSMNGTGDSVGGRFRCSFVNLGHSSPLSFASPMDPVKYTVSTTDEEFTAWDFVEVMCYMELVPRTLQHVDVYVLSHQ